MNRKIMLFKGHYCQRSLALKFIRPHALFEGDAKGISQTPSRTKKSNR